MDSINLFLIIILGLSLLLLLGLIKQQRETKKLLTIQKEELDIEKDVEKRKTFSTRFVYFTSLRKKIDAYFHFKKNKHMTVAIYYGILVTEFLLFIGFLFLNKPIFAIAFPLTLHVASTKIFDLLSLNIHFYIQRELPNAIKHLIKVMSRTSDLKTIMYETSKNLDEPLRGIFFDMSRRMITEKPEKILMEYAEEIDDIWFYAFAFLLVSYKEHSKKEDIITNLTTLANMLDKETYLKEKNITDKKFVTVMNYGLTGIAVLLFIANLVWNREVAIPFFFNNMTGMVAMIFGIWGIIGTVIINLMMTKRTD